MKYIKIISLVLLLIMSLSINIYAVNGISDFHLEKIISGASNFMSQAVNDPNGASNKDVKDNVANFVKQFAGIIIGIAIIVIILWGLFIGIQLMSSSAMSQAQVKEALTPFAIGCIVVFGGWTIWSICVRLLEEI